MKINTPVIHYRGITLLFSTCAVLVVAMWGLAAMCGCEATAGYDLTDVHQRQTASYKYVFEQASSDTHQRTRTWTESTVAYEDVAVTHFPFWFEDPFVVDGDGNDSYGWTGMDYVAMVYCPLRGAVNLFGLPASMVVEPPGILVETRRTPLPADPVVMEAHPNSPHYGKADSHDSQDGTIVDAGTTEHQ